MAQCASAFVTGNEGLTGCEQAVSSAGRRTGNSRGNNNRFMQISCPKPGISGIILPTNMDVSSLLTYFKRILSGGGLRRWNRLVTVMIGAQCAAACLLPVSAGCHTQPAASTAAVAPPAETSS